MKERGILFSDEMVRALLDGRKTQTRRAVKLREFQVTTTPGYDFIFRDRRLLWNDYRTADLIAKVCPYGKVGDRLWVRETWAPFYAGGNSLAHPQPDMHEANAIRYRATPDHVTAYPTSISTWETRPTSKKDHVWRPSIFMPRWASRITLDVTEVRVQRLQDISEDDARAEGCPSMIESLAGLSHLRGAEAARAVPSHITTPREEYALLWERINGDGSWDANPWVWAITFKRVEAASRAA